ncbi:hypothetical protein DEJ48_15080 [Streptomyces venezuelae]|uniref:Lipoprotein n=1 Tax=Streptomyces venezuelae TaxID=54571 RepID=A0A5P2BVM9_STRVZ|nr:hypothetical protein [Streptomyces venezuelae]QES34545.1 hypothetical protein DEJ48_15080 [Streptomyces venezuelae]
MNRHPLRLTTAALAVSAALLLTACGSGGGDGGSSDKIEGADVGGKPKASASAEPDGSERPGVKLPSAFKADFVGWHHSDPKKQAILDDGRERLKAEYLAIIDADPQAKPLGFYTSMQALKSSQKYVKGYVDTDDTLVGSVRVFNPQVSLSDAGGVLFYCVDESKGYTENRRTKKRAGTPDDTDPVLQYRTTLRKNSDGVWSTVSLETERGGCDK